ncbi:hypothetical protein T492DRAFT_199061 [Pavlovales sp. CCMP2436]|nr:hypothetical protein T492DRAFT_199061 [Pavlovales sp. CCMP2436]
MPTEAAEGARRLRHTALRLAAAISRASGAMRLSVDPRRGEGGRYRLHAPRDVGGFGVKDEQYAERVDHGRVLRTREHLSARRRCAAHGGGEGRRVAQPVTQMLARSVERPIGEGHRRVREHERERLLLRLEEEVRRLRLARGAHNQLGLVAGGAQGGQRRRGAAGQVGLRGWRVSQHVHRQRQTSGRRAGHARAGD